MRADYKIENIVASASLDGEINLYKAAHELDNVEYEPEQFPGAIIKLDEPETSLLMFKNGKIICTGGKSKEEVYNAVEKAVEQVKPFLEED